MQICASWVWPTLSSEIRPSTPPVPSPLRPRYPVVATGLKLAATYPFSTARERVYVNIDEHDVSVQLSDRVPLSTTWNHRPLAGSWYFLIASASRCRIVRTFDRFGCVVGTVSSTIVVAMPYQPTARHHDSGEWFVPGTTQLCVADSSYAWYSKPFGDCRCVL